MKAATNSATILGVIVTLVALYLQYQTAQDSSEDQKKFLDAINAQTVVLEKIQNEQRVQGERARPAEPKTAAKSPALKSPKSRRSQVYKEHRHTLKARRETFGKSRAH